MTNNTINNYTNYITESEEVYSDLFNETFTIFDDYDINKFVNKSLKRYASDIANLMFYLVGNKFGVSGNDKDI